MTIRLTPSTDKLMKKGYMILLAGTFTLSAGCKDFLDVNTNPNAPETVAPNLYLAPMLHWMVTSPQFDGRYVSLYTQQLHHTGTGIPATTWGRMGFDPTSDNGAQQWRDVYWSFGQNLVDMMAKAEAEERWDLLGIGHVLKAWGWQALTDLHGEIIVHEAIDPTKYTFNYDSQEEAYTEVRRLLDSAIVLLQRTDGNVNATYVGRGDKIYGGDRAKWLRFAYGLLAIHLNHYSNKSTYNQAAVIAAVDASFSGNADDALLTYPNTNNDDINFLGRTRGNFQLYRQTQFVVGLMNGTQFGVTDPRMTRMLVPDSAGTAVVGLDINVLGSGAALPPQQPRNPHGYVGTGGTGVPGWYLFDDRAKMPAMTYAQLQFVKAEAAFRMGDRATALTAFRNGVSAHIDFVNARNLDNNQSGRSPTIAPTQISAAEKAAFLASPTAVPTTTAELTLTHIMSQKYIAQWAWGHNEMWLDMRRYHYTDLDPATLRQVYPGFTPPTTLYVLNSNKVVQRIRPRYNSEYIWNRAGLDAIGGLADDYQTVPLWITQP